MSPAPAFTPTTEDLYDSLPEHFRTADASAPGDYPLKRYLALHGDGLDDLVTLIERIQFTPVDEGGAPGDTSELVDPALADAAWLPWLGQLVGVNVGPGLSEAAARDAVEFAPAGWRSATKQAIADAARTVLTGTKYAAVYDHHTGAGAAGQWYDILVITRPFETPDPDAVIPAILAKDAKPAGAVLHYQSYAESWTAIEAAFPDWTDVEAAGSWDEVQDAGV